MKASAAILFSLALFFTAMVRFTPSMYTNVFFSNDIWPLTHLAEHILKKPTVGIYSLAGVYGHHAEYPFSILLCIVYILTTGASLEQFFKYIGTPLLAIAMFLSVYILAAGFSHSRRSCLLASLSISLMPSFTVYTSAYLKEFYSHILIPIILYLAIYRGKPRIPLATSLAILSLALVMGHPLASAMSIAILFSYLYVGYTHFIKGRKLLKIDSGYLVATLLLTTVFIFYTSITAKPPIEISVNDLLIFTIYIQAIYLAYLLLGDLGSGFLTTIALLPALLSLYNTTTISISIVPLALYVAPLLLSIIYRTGTATLDRIREAVLLPTAAILLYILTYMVEALGIIHRVANYLVYALIPIAISLGENRGKMGLAVFTLLALATAMCSMLVALNQDPYTFYWRYGEYDTILRYLTKITVPGTRIYGDPKYSYMIPEIIDVPLTAARELCKLHGFIVLSKDNYIYGIPITPIDFYRLPSNLHRCRSIVFNTGYTHVLA